MNITKSNNEDYIPVLVKTSFVNNHEYYEIDGDKDLSLKQYLDTITETLTNLINKKKNAPNKYKIQLSIGINFISIDGTEDIFTFYVRSDAKKFKTDGDTSKIITKLIRSSLNNYRKILIDKPDYIFYNILLLSIHINMINYDSQRKKIKNLY